MDTYDHEIVFDEDGVCNHCKLYFNIVSNRVFPGDLGKDKLNELVREIKDKGQRNEYDCIIGVSGGVDSSYVLYKLKELGLRPLAVHLDNGWNSELAVSNIEKMLKKMDIDLYTYVIDWEEFKDLQISFLKASVPDLEIPTDHAIMAILYKLAIKHKVKYIISGTNFATELIMPRSWSQGHTDWRYIRSIHKIFGNNQLRTFPYYSISMKLYYRYIKQLKFVSLLNYISYNKEEAIKTLENELCWKYYGGKHYESIYTRFIQAYILPKKFNIDKRRGHFSNLICAGQITRDEALMEMMRDPYPEGMLTQDKEFVLKKLGIDEDYFEYLMNLQNKSFWDYPSYRRTMVFKAVRALYVFLKKLSILDDL